MAKKPPVLNCDCAYIHTSDDLENSPHLGAKRCICRVQGDKKDKPIPIFIIRIAAERTYVGSVVTPDEYPEIMKPEDWVPTPRRKGYEHWTR